MRQEPERDESLDATYLAGMEPEGNATPHDIGGLASRGRAGSSSGADTNAMVALTQTLVALLPPRSALLPALSLGARFLPHLRSLALYALPDGTRASLTLVGEVEVGAGDEGTEVVARDLWQRRTTLGHGGALDARVLNEREVCRVGGSRALPLISPELDLVGVLVAEEREPTHQRNRVPLLDVLAACLTVLIERHLRDEAAARRERALDALSDLTLNVAGPDRQPEDEASVRDAVLSTAADMLRELARPLSSVALVLTADGSLREAEASLESSEGAPSAVAAILLDPVRTAEVLAALHGETALTVSAGHASGIWDDLAPLRERADERGDLPVERMTLLPVRVGAEVQGVLAVTHAQGGASVRDWLPTATAIAIAAGAGLRASHLTHAVAEEARARDEFISLAAHELRSPLTSTKGYAQLLQRQTRKVSVPESMLRSIEAIEEQSLRMAEMVSELLDASRIRRSALTIQLANTDLVPIVLKVVEKRRAQYPHHRIALHLGAPALQGNWDAQRVEQIVRDLLDNAARFSPDGGPIAITVTNVDGLARVSVRDEGTGIAPEDQSYIFDYLYRAPAAKERNLSGLGLGLYICRALAERMGGRLDLHETAQGETHGSEFHLSLPLAG